MRQLSTGSAHLLLRCAAFSAALLCATSVAQAQGVYFTRESVLKELFADAERVDYLRLETRTHAGRLRDLLGYVPTREQYVIFVGWLDARVVGYALIDDEVGQHLPISFATRVGPDGAVQRTEVMAYREAYGHEIRQRRFQNQFRGKKTGDALRVGRDIDAISGATISSRSMAVAVRRAVAIIDLARARHTDATVTASSAAKETAGATR